MANADEGKAFRKKWWLHPMDPENLVELSNSDRRNAKSLNDWLLVWGVLFFGTVLTLEPIAGGVGATPAWRFMLAILPLVPGILLVRAFVRFFRETRDEFIRKIHFEALAAGFLFAFLVGMGFELSSVIVGDSVKAGPAMFCGLLLGYFISLTMSYRKYNA